MGMRARDAWLPAIGASLLCIAGALPGPGSGAEPPSRTQRSSAPRTAKPDISRYAAGYGGIVFTEIPAARAPGTAGMLRSTYGEGGRLVLLRKDGSTHVLSSGFESASDPAVSIDGSHILFAARKTAISNWDIFEMAADGSGIDQITQNTGNCRSPLYQSALFYLNDEHPSYQITFVSDAGGELHEAAPSGKTDLYSVRFDGSGLRRLTYGLSSSYDPFQMQDGRILFAQWQHGRLDAGRSDLFAVQLDGTDYAGFSGTQGLRIKHMACVTSKGKVVFVESERPSWDGSGSLGTISLRRNLHSYGPLTAPAEGSFHTPSPLPDGSILVSRRAAGGGNHAIYRLDPESGSKDLVFEEPGYHSIQAVAVVRRTEPDGHSSVVEDDQNWSRLYCLSVYENDLKREWFPLGIARRVRVIEALPRTAGESPGTAQKRLLGDVELDNDGSFHLTAPPNMPVQLQIEDSDGMALLTSAWIWAKNKENRGCIGCHEDGERTPENIFAQALSHPAADLMLPPGRRRTVDFRRDVAPILAARCSNQACHGGSVEPIFSGVARAYENLFGKPSPPRANRAAYVDPGRARTSRLVWAIFGRNTARPWDRLGAVPAPKQMPPSGSPALTELERRAIIEWIDLGAEFGAPSAGSTAPPAGANGGQR
jgi:Hydrazine synthase alpha subunit middle domain